METLISPNYEEEKMFGDQKTQNRDSPSILTKSYKIPRKSKLSTQPD